MQRRLEGRGRRFTLLVQHGELMLLEA
jgi:hypothetical protein